ncbi:RNA polymerase sigma factor [Robiginitalea sp. IMCC43444]|uniref:RNA polymerase sigma factor n=1 Tax=Robiginitalea sp. IMCC43444 TaxID=3459121 RepID=UPI004042149E
MDIEKEFTAIYNNHASRVFRLCLGYASGNPELAKEWQQDTFIKVWNHRKSFKGKSSISTWIYRIAVNTCLADLKKSTKQFPIKDNMLQMTMEPDQEEQEDKVPKMYDCINQLSKNNKTLILMELEEIPQASIAETLGINHGAVRTRLNRIRKALLKCITDEK